MANATINGSPSLFVSPVFSPVNPNPITDYATRVNDFLSIATDMATESETEMTDADWLNDPATQAELNAWHDSLNTPEAFDAYDAWVTEQERLAEDAAICERYDADAEAYAELGCGARHYLAGHDAVWQNGGSL